MKLNLNKRMGNLKNKVNNLITGLMVGIKNTENEIFTQLGGSTVADSTISQEAHSSRVSKALLKGELTQEVKELRYRTYMVDREAKKYEYFSPTLAKKVTKDVSKFVKYENADNLKIITIQPNERKVESLTEYESRNTTDISEGNIFVEPKKEFTIKITRNFVPRFKIEDFTTRLAVFEIEKKVKVRLDFYVSKYPNKSVFISKGFVREVEDIRDNGVRSDILGIETVSFTTNHAYILDDMIEFEFNNIVFEKVIEYDGHYILRFNANIVKNGVDELNNFYNKEMAERYKNKEKKERVLDLTEAFTERYICENCGKEIYYDVNSIDNLNPSKPRDIDEEVEDMDKDDVTEYYDMQIAEQTFGKRLCSKCLREYMKNMEEINELS